MNEEQLTITELTDQVQNYLTMSGTLPCYLKNDEIMRIIQQDASAYFYRKYRWATARAYYFIPYSTFKVMEKTGDKYEILLPEVEAVLWTYIIDDRSLFQIGINAPNMSINVGVTNQPYINSFLTTVGELGVYKASIDSFADVLNSMTKTTVKYWFNPNTKRYGVATSITKSLMLEVAARIEPESLYADPYFQRYVKALAKIQLGTLLTFADMTLVGGVKLNGEALKADGVAERDKVIEEINAMAGVTSFIRMIRR